jgi:RNA polymerase sigma factor (sigma-70 family)
MAAELLRVLLRRLRHVTDPAGDAAPSDEQLLQRFVAFRDQAAFELLVWRHGTMVLNLCRRVLRHENDAEDAFQATFLILARKAGSISRREACASWLYKVAFRVAVAARAVAAARAEREGPCPDDVPAAEEPDDLAWRDLRPVLDEEVRRLPEKYRTAFVLCCLQGRTNAEAAAELGCPAGTVLSRLSRARERLRQRLLRRGVSLSAGAIAAAVAAKGQAVEVSAGLVTTTSKAALGVAAGKAVAAVASARAAALTEGVIRAMFVSKVKLTLSLMLALGLVGLGAGLVGEKLRADPPRRAQAAPGEQPAAVAVPEGATAAAGKKADPGDPAREALRRLQTRRSLQQIGLAVHNYADAYGKLPAPAIYEGFPNGLPAGAGAEGPTGGGLGSAAGAGGPAPGAGSGAPVPGGASVPGGEGASGAAPAVSGNAKALLSWRVAILPFIGEDNLYKQFKLDQPWDSEHNKKLLAQMPAAYAPPGARDRDGDKTYYQAIVGAGAAWEPRTQLRWPVSITDGTSNTILVVEAATPVPWTKPEDLPYVADQGLPKFGGLFGGDFHALLADGSVVFLSRNADEVNLRGAITRAGGEVVDFDKMLAGGGRGPGTKLDLDELPRMNQQLKEAVEAATKEIAVEKEELELLKVKVAAGTPKIDPKTAKLVKEHAELQRALEAALEQLDELRTQRERLEHELRGGGKPQTKPIQRKP